MLKCEKSVFYFSLFPLKRESPDHSIYMKPFSNSKPNLKLKKAKGFFN